MPTHVALLRGINVGGRSKVATADLRRIVESLGYGDLERASEETLGCATVWRRCWRPDTPSSASHRDEQP